MTRAQRASRPRKTQVPVGLDADLLRRLDEECHASERNRSQIIRVALRMYLPPVGEHPSVPPPT